MKLVPATGPVLTYLVPRSREPLRNEPLIAIVDDDPCLRTAVGRLLSLCGFRPLLFDSGEAFLETHTAHPVACVLLDLMMPGLSGFHVKEQLVKSAPHLPVILITAAADPEIRKRARRQGFVACLAKPFGDSVLIPLINQALRHTPTQSLAALTAFHR